MPIGIVITPQRRKSHLLGREACQGEARETARRGHSPAVRESERETHLKPSRPCSPFIDV